MVKVGIKPAFTVIKLDISNLTAGRRNMMILTKAKVKIPRLALVVVIVTIVILSIIQIIIKVYSLIKVFNKVEQILNAVFAE